MSERIRYWLNFGEDGPWAWWWFQIRAGCWRGHDWVEETEWESIGDAVYAVDTFRACRRCGQWGGFLE